MCSKMSDTKKKYLKKLGICPFSRENPQQLINYNFHREKKLIDLTISSK